MAGQVSFCIDSATHEITVEKDRFRNNIYLGACEVLRDR
jgi:hypothetical protein